jgi:hypothetical protein
MTKLEQILERFNEFEDFEQEDRPLTADGFDDAIIGIDVKDFRMVYSQEKCLSILMERDGMTYEEASEYFEFNTLGAYVGKMTPIYVYTGEEL